MTDIFGEQHRLERMLKERDAEIERLRALLTSIQKHPDTPMLIAGVVRNELEK